MGDLSVTLLEADSLIATDPNGASDPYVTMCINGDHRTLRKSKTVRRSLAPVWNEVYEWRLSNARGAIVDVRVFDRDRLNRDDPMGATAIMIDTLIPFVSNDMMLPLKGVRSGRIHLYVVWKPTGVAPPAAKPVAMAQPAPMAYGAPAGGMAYHPTAQPAPTAYAPTAYAPTTAPAPAYSTSAYSTPSHPTPPGMPSYSKAPMVVPGSQGPTPIVGSSYGAAPTTATYGQPASYGAPASTTYGAPTAYGAPATYGAAPTTSYGAPPPSYGASAGYGGELKKPAPSGMPPPVMLTPGAGAGANLKFFQKAHQTSVRRNYMLVIDKSGSMAGGNWREAVAAVRSIAPFVCRADPDGISLYLFSNGPVLCQKNVRTAQDVETTFARAAPGGSTDLTGVLQLCLGEHFNDPRKTPSTILVITDGEPDDEASARALITSAANDIARDEDLSISFVQVGRAPEAARFLKGLDDNIRAKFDIVDTLSFNTMLERGVSFEQMIALSVND